jgi:hypothetical protein
MWKDGKIERVGANDGAYRLPDTDCTAEDWLNKECKPVKFYIPLELTDKVYVSPGDVILVAGSQNAGKCALLMNIAKDNRNIYNVHYFSSEMSAAKFKRRMQRFQDIDVSELAKKIKFYKRGAEFADVIKTGEGNLNVIDYLEIHDSFYHISGQLAKIFNKLDGAITVIALQKEPGRDFGRGGSFTQEKPVLALSLDYGVAKVTKCKEFPDNMDNPQGKIYHFKLVQGCRFMRKHADLGWHKEQENKHGI